ncbi:HlyD family secretion protein [uncultured Alistipes sp.]|uniref:HlyD family secretion protein n=1 Tax=uncultured Alistipes sp. TaxID=538949 RepID=UPI00266C9C2F|nr:HlyD family efflux transporter periplasmic adaptor subunit [uncultured Alistipes sp.]
MPQRDSFYSDEAQEIIGSVPSWVVRWGITVVFVIFAGIVAGCYFIKYPQIVTAPITITTVNPPADLAARYDGLLDTVCVSNGDTVRQGQLLALFATPARYDDISAIERSLQGSCAEPLSALVRSEWLDETYTLGDLQSTWAEFLRQCLDYRHYLDIDYIGRKKQLLAAQIDKNAEYYDRLQTQKRLLLKDLDYGRRTLERDSLLLSEAVISSADYEATAQGFLSKQNSKAGFDATLTSTELTILQTRQQIVELSVQEENEKAEYEHALDQLRQQLLAGIAQWKEQYAVIAPAGGRVSLQSYWSRGQHVSVGSILASIVPEGKTEVLGRMQVPSSGFGKVKQGQAVNVKLNGFPYMEFGVLKGTIRSISAVPVQTAAGVAYTVEVVFPGELTTTYKKELPLIQQMDGTGEIITEDMRLIEQFIRPVVSLFKNR